VFIYLTVSSLKFLVILRVSLTLLLNFPPNYGLSLSCVYFCCLVQTDPNWSNFLYDEATKVINLIDFGAARDYPKSFVEDYLRMVSSLCATLGLLFDLKSLSIFIFSCMCIY
jgi:hypothetical protein